MTFSRVLGATLFISTFVILLSGTSGQSRRPYSSSGGVNILFVRASSVEVGFNYVQGVTRYYVNAREWVDGKRVGNEASGIWLNSQKRSTILRNLNPGREYLIRVQAYAKDRPIGSRPQKVVRTSQQCYTCNAMPDNEQCKGPEKEFECPHDKDACLNEVRYSKGVPKITKRCAQWRPELGRQIQNGRDVTIACSGRENIKDVACKCMCRSNLCNEVEVPCLNECFKELPTPDNSYIRCTKEEKVGSVCRWFCLPGYKIKGTSRSDCRRDRTWSVLNPPECIEDPNRKQTVDDKFNCPNLEPGENADMTCTNANKPGSVCTFKCNSNNILRGSFERECDGSTSKWTGVAHTCVEITCSVIEERNGLTKECTANETIGSVCDFSCPEDRKFLGSRRLICQGTGRWSSTIPRCGEPDCSVLPSLFDNVLMECSRIPNRETGKMCLFSCKEGYEINGPTRTFCYEGNSWTNNSPTCRRIRCQPPMFAPRNGFVRCSKRDYYDSVCAFSCENGYMLRGPKQRVCGIGGWSEESPICKSIRCPAIRNFNGLYSCNQGQNFGSICRFSCLRGFGFEEGVTTRLQCVGKSEDELEAGPANAMLGRWSSRVPRCVVIGCPELGAVPDNSERKCTSDSNNVGTVCSYQCDSGYSMMGPSRTTCVASSDGGARGEWSHPQPFCQRVTCKPLPDVANGNVECTDGEYAGSACSVACRYGYNLRGQNPVRCSVEGLWSRRLGRCNVVTCIGVLRLINGRYVCGRAFRYEFNHECEAKCNTGFKLSTPGQAVCGVKGNWLTSEDVKCEDENECEALDRNGERTNGFCEQNCVNTIGSYYCDCEDDYKLNEDGRTCTITVCPEPEAVERGRIWCSDSNRIGSRCSLRCVPGFYVAGRARINCLVTGSWDRDFGSCERISCERIEIPQHGSMTCDLRFKFGSTCEFDCIEGFILRGRGETRCGADGDWTSAIPWCEREICDDTFMTVTNAKVDCTDGNKFESVCDVTCNKGYKLNGVELDEFKTTIECEAGASWDMTKPTCVRKRCQPSYEQLVRRRPNGKVSCTEEDLLGSTCLLLCDEGYEVEGEFRTQCVGDAKWSKNLGFCIKIKCPKLAKPKQGQLSCSEGAAYQSRCVTTCEEGYEIVGENVTDCQASRKWTEDVPTCERKTCPIFTTLRLLKGTVSCTDEVNTGSQCTFQCDPGHEFAPTGPGKQVFAGLVEGIATDMVKLVCEDNKVWSEAQPRCVPHECTPPSRVMREREENGNIQCSDGDKYKSVCELSCEKGFEVVRGRSSTVCTEDRSWAPKLGLCARVRCPMFKPLVNGAILCSDSNFYESRCKFGCHAGYRIVGSALSVCQADRTFTNEAPTCTKIECPSIQKSLKNGNVTCTDGSFFESECVMTCDTGYEMVHDVTHIQTLDKVIRRCLASGTWAGDQPVCRRKKCSMNDGAIAKARIHGEVTCPAILWFQSVCTVECHTGFRLVGPSRTECLANSDWYPPLGYCERRTCPTLRTPRYGSMDCTNENKFESICKFRCEYGYELIGFEESECLAMGRFSVGSPFCREILCPPSFMTADNATVKCSDTNKLDSECVYKCDDGYQLTETSFESLVCTDTYSWSESKPKCEKKTCPQADQRLIRAAEHGTLICSDANRFQSICKVDCFPGYKITEGGAFTECRSNQKWGPDLGYCIKISCEEFPPLDNGATSCTDGLRYQSVCSFSCAPGYELSHRRSATCQADRTFSDTQPECSKIQCSRFHLRISNGKTTCSESNYFSSICEYECAVGFERVTGSETAECLADGSWSARKTGCERIFCDGNADMFVKARNNGEVSCTSHYFYGSVCSVTCDAGYELSVESRSECIGTGRWEGELGVCARIECRDLSSPNNGTVGCNNRYLYESVCTFTCDSGFEMDGPSETTCQVDRTWTNDEATCQKIECSNDNLFLSNGESNCTDSNKYLSVCQYRCDSGYEMEEEVLSTTCTATRAWSRNKPTCVKKVCDFESEMILRALENGGISCTDENRYQSVCSLECNEGYELTSGVEKIECDHTGNWDEQIGHCQKIVCPSLLAPFDGDMECSDENRYQSICSFSCDAGYEMSGSSRSECLANRTFSNPAPDCKITQCPADHLTIAFGSVTCTDSNNYKSICQFQCMDGFEMLVKEESSRCLSNQTWSVDPPICEKKTCPYDAHHLLLAEENGTVHCTEANRYGSICSVDCNEGFEIFGEETTECTREATWSQPIGYCKKIKCFDLPVDDDTQKFCSDGNFFNSSCSFSCAEGYAFSSANLSALEEVTVTCQANETWTTPGSAPDCEETSCPDGFLDISNADVSCSSGTLYQSQCLVRCKEGYELEKPFDDFDVTTIIATCLANSSWDAEKPVCRRIRCLPDLEKDEIILQHGNVKCTYGADYESVCTLTCNDGYAVAQIANETITETTCGSDGAWTPLLGSCQKISCPALTAPSNSTLQCSDEFNFKSACQVICQPGYAIHNPENDYNEKVGLECKANGEWCGELPKCAKVQCPRDNLDLREGAVSCTDENFFQSECRYYCDAGYQMIQGQSDVTTCTPHQTWSHALPTCQKQRCPANDTSFREAGVTGEIICTEENKFRSECELHCAQGYELTGRNSATCLKTGDWSNGIGLCNKIRCGEVKKSENTKMECSDQDRFESFCTFSCVSGFMMSQDSLKAGNGVVCKASGNWEGVIINCEKISCPTMGFTRIENGRVACNDSNRFLSRCLFECDGGFELEHQIDPESRVSAIVNCTDRGLWDVPSAPKCRPVRCDVGVSELQEKVENAILDCSDGSNFQSECQISCLSGYRLVGESKIVCGSDKKWGPAMGSCEKISCQTLHPPTNGRMICDNGFKYMSQCVFDCEPGFVKLTSGSGVTTCKADGDWIGDPPTCERSECDRSYLTLPDGTATCTRANLFESECEFSCKPGFQLESGAVRVAKCQGSGLWSSDKPRCYSKTCESALTANGELECSGTEYDAVCRLKCGAGYRLVGAPSSTCTDSRLGGTEWRPPLGRCEKISCSELNEIPNGRIVCSDGSRFRSVCYVLCDRGFRVNGTTFSTKCQQNGEWSNAMQTCNRVTCDPSYLSIEYGSRTATDANNFGSRLKFYCPAASGFKFVGAREVTCLENGHWSRAKPTCKKLTCPALHVPHGRATCTGQRYNDYQSRCVFSCDPNYQLIGSDTAECQTDGTWSQPTPHCKGRCDGNLDELKHGKSVCTNSNYHFSRCSFECDAVSTNGMPLVMYGNDYLTCRQNGRWDGTPPCCIAECVPNAKMDLFFVLHSSASQTHENWVRITRLVNSILGTFNVGQDNVQAGVVRYHRDVDSNNEISIGQHASKILLQRAVRFLRFGGDGTNTGQALSHVARSSLRRSSNRPGVSDTVVLIVDETSQDDVKIGAEMLKMQNATVYVIAIRSESNRLSVDELSTIATSPEHIIVADGYEQVNSAQVRKELTNRLCKNPCLHNAEYRQSRKDPKKTAASAYTELSDFIV